MQKQEKYKKSIVERKKTSKCNFCHKVGHWERECRAKKRQIKAKMENNRQRGRHEMKLLLLQ